MLRLSETLPESCRALLNAETIWCSQFPDSNLMDFTEFIFHSKAGDVNLIKFTKRTPHCQTKIRTSYATLSRGIPWNIPQITCIF